MNAVADELEHLAESVRELIPDSYRRQPRIARRVAGQRPFLLDIRRAPPPVAEWLREDRRFDDGVPYLEAPPAGAFDVLLYVDSVSPACPG